VKITQVRDVEQLRDFMTTPTEGLVELMRQMEGDILLVELMRQMEGDILVLGGGGKVGPELVETITRANASSSAAAGR